MIKINYNGPGNTTAQSFKDLLALLETEPLDPVFEKYGNFYEQFPEMADGSKSTVPNYFFGNFFNVSHGFSIDIDEADQATADTLLAAIRANQATLAYEEAKADSKAYTLRMAAEARAAEKAKKAKGV